MPHLYTWRAGGCRIYGPAAGESGPWFGTCENGLRHLGPRDPVTGEKPPVCKHLHTLLKAANDGFLSSKFIETRAGKEKTDGGCACNDNQPLHRLPPPTPPPAPVLGVPSRNRACPCGSGELYKRCHGAEGGPPAGAPPMPGEKPAKPSPTPEELEARHAEQKRAKRARDLEYRAKERHAKKERKKREDLAIEHAHQADEARREARRKRDAAKKERENG